MDSQSASSVLMIRPTSFGFDDQTAKTNVFQHHMRLKPSSVTKKALEEFKASVEILRKLDIDVIVFADDTKVIKPSAVFVNNWLSTWPDGKIYLYPMATESRRPERNPRVLDELKKRFVVSAITDISAPERQEKSLESTGAMIFDHLNKQVYACLSPRCDTKLLKQHAAELRYEPILFHAVDRDVPVYHTNVLLSIQNSSAIICTEVIPQIEERKAVVKKLKDSGRVVVEISKDQMEKFCGNVLEIRNRAGKRFLILSQTALDNLTPEQKKALSVDKVLVPLNIPTIETIGGGSARCMMAEIFLPPKV